MQCVLSQASLRHVAAWRSHFLARAICKPSLLGECSANRQTLVPRCLSSSASAKAAEPRKAISEEEAEPRPPQRQAGPGARGRADPARAHDEPPGESREIDPLQDKSIGLVQRFKKTFKQYGKVLIPVHLLTSSLWFGTFYYASMKGINVVPFLEYIGLPEKFVTSLRDSQSGYALNAYAMFKLATPARYTITLGGTSISVKYLRKRGYFCTPPPVKEYIQDKMEETREKISEKMEETKERFSEKMEETKELFSGRMEETKERFTEKMEETKDKISEKIKGPTGKVSFRKKI